MDTPYVREYHEDREITAWFLLDLSPSVDFGTVGGGPPEADRADRLRRRRSPGCSRGAATGSARWSTAAGRRARSPSASGRVAGPAPRRRPARASRGSTPRRAPTSRRSWSGPSHDQAALADRDRVRLHQRSPAGSGRSTSSTSATSCSPCASWTRASASCRTSGPVLVGGRGDRRAARDRHRRRRVPAAVRGAAADGARGRRRPRVRAGRRRGASRSRRTRTSCGAIVRMAAERRRRRRAVA